MFSAPRRDVRSVTQLVGEIEGIDSREGAAEAWTEELASGRVARVPEERWAVRKCRFCQGITACEPACRACGGIDSVVPLADFLALRDVHQDCLAAACRELRFLESTTENLLLRICAELSLRRFSIALPLLRRVCRGQAPDSSISSLLKELISWTRSEALAVALLARERGELGQRRIILSVDDSATVRRVLELAFAREQHVVVSVENAERALAALSEIRPDIVFVDFQLPDLDGLDLCRRLKREAKTHEVPVVVLSGKVGPGFEEEARSAGASGFLVKPASTDALLEMLRRLTG